jgi:hypothetical protein
MNPQSCCKALLWIYHSLLYDRGSDPHHGSEEHFVLFSVGFGYPTWSVLYEHYCVALDVSSLLHMVLGANLTDLSDTLFESELCERSPKQPLSVVVVLKSPLIQLVSSASIHFSTESRGDFETCPLLPLYSTLS